MSFTKKFYFWVRNQRIRSCQVFLFDNQIVYKLSKDGFLIWALRTEIAAVIVEDGIEIIHATINYSSLEEKKNDETSTIRRKTFHFISKLIGSKVMRLPDDPPCATSSRLTIINEEKDEHRIRVKSLSMSEVSLIDWRKSVKIKKEEEEEKKTKTKKSKNKNK